MIMITPLWNKACTRSPFKGVTGAGMLKVTLRQTLWLAGVIFFASPLWHCAQEEAPGSEVIPSEQDDDNDNPYANCVDADHDGFGTACKLGPDCDDHDNKRNVSCNVHATCEPGTTNPCYELYSVSQDALHCVAGTRTCGDGLWGSCNMEREFSLPIPPQLAGLITGPVQCNPCSPSCALSTDYPVTTDLTPDNSVDVVYNPGLGGLVVGSSGSGSGMPDADGDGVPDAHDSCPSNPSCDGWGDNPTTCAACLDLGDIFHVLPYDAASVFDPLQVETTVRTADVYLLMDNTASMGEEIGELKNALTLGNYLLRPHLCGQVNGTMSNWTAQYYPTVNLSGTPVTVTETEIAHNWKYRRPSVLSINDNAPFSVRWTGTFTPAAAGNYYFSGTYDDAMRVYLDGNLLTTFNDWSNGTERFKGITVNLSAVPHTIKVEYYENADAALAYFAISKPEASLPSAYKGLVGAIRCEIADVQFGVGYHDDYPYTTPEDNGSPNCNAKTADNSPRKRDKPYGNLQSITASDSLVDTAVAKYAAACGGDLPESQLSALYSVSTGHGLIDNKGNLSYGSMTVVDATEDIDLSATPIAVTGTAPFADTFATAKIVGGIGDGPAKRYSGNSNSQVNNYSALGGGCAGSTAPDMVFKFTLSDTRGIVITARGSSFATTIHLIASDTTTVLACNRGNADAEVAAVLDPGTYYAVLDGKGNANKGDYVLSIGSRIQETIVTPLHLGTRSSSWIKTSGATTDTFFSDNMNDSGCVPEGGLPGRDVFFSFDVATRTEMGVILDNAVKSTGPDDNEIMLLLYDSALNLLNCSERRGNTAGFLGDLDAGTYYLRVDNTSATSRTDFRLAVGPWATVPLGDNSKRWFNTPQTSCPAGTWGYPCFRDKSFPIVMLLTDNRFHDGPSYVSNTDNVTYVTPAFLETVRTLQERAIKVVGIHSGTPVPTETCEQECLSGHTGNVCQVKSVCSAYGPQECEPAEKCSGGQCWTINKCTKPCIGTWSNQNVCEQQFICDSYSPVQTCTVGYATKGGGQHLSTLAANTGTFHADGTPMVYQIGGDGSGLSTSVVRSISDLAEGSRMNITLRVNDDPATTSVDERLFVKSITATPTAETLARCLLPQPSDWFYACLPGTNATFTVEFRNNFITPTASPQVFNFSIETFGDGAYLLSTTTVRIVVPTSASSSVPTGRYWRDYDSTDACEGTERPVWGNLAWTATFPADTSIKWQLQTANTKADLGGATAVFVTAPTTSSPINISEKLEAAGEFTELPFLRVTAILQANAALTSSPVLHGFEVKYTCEAAE